MADRAMDVYLNDHLAGATLGSNLAAQIRDRHEGTPLGEVMRTIAAQVEEDRRTLIALMERLDVSSNPVKRASGWVAEKASQVKFSGVASGEPDHGAFMALESLTLGVLGKLSLWQALEQVESDYPQLAPADLDELVARAEAQHATLEQQRLAAGKRALANDGNAR
jgi:hypothetical protein